MNFYWPGQKGKNKYLSRLERATTNEYEPNKSTKQAFTMLDCIWQILYVPFKVEEEVGEHTFTFWWSLGLHSLF